MALRLEDKQQIVAEVNKVAAGALSAVVADYRGMTVGQLTELRALARSGGVYLRVVRNTLAKRAVVGTEFECLDPALVGPSLFAFSLEDPGAAARVLKDAVKAHDALEVRAIALGGKLMDGSQLDAVAKLPTKDQAISMLMSVMNAPITKLAQTLDAIPTKLVRTVVAVKDQKEQAA
ncbi:50S ribosomal protein L10 [Litorivicinus lipolyticus]|uniref:Large ribosomal subunit protein uL10 n=1 Tax=Litorivicinus lipolyticus TaxID=418701 RepID=A0A5Q2QGA9_9GAMM|nr:50S ribosomal protein L10 [Litorivicinus lipolyticus]QGG80870.1 50S ribosomal protein L10 [Litorivicinus lipolyticus]